MSAARAGVLPQTAASPPPGGPVLRAEMSVLWRAVLTGDPTQGLPAFFPLAAYLQVKTVPDPAGDWRSRLVGEFGLDVRAAHALLGPGRPAVLADVVVPAGQAGWVLPGSCANRVGYWHVGGARLLYRSGGVLRSFGIASMISWRGVWYVVHLGAVLRPGAGGVVDSPALGAGSPGPAGGC